MKEKLELFYKEYIITIPYELKDSHAIIFEKFLKMEKKLNDIIS